MSANELMSIIDERAQILQGKVTQVMNYGNHQYRTVRGFFEFEGRTLRVSRKGKFTLNGKPFDINTLPKKEGRVYLVSKICAAYAQRDDFVFVINSQRRGPEHYLFTL